MSGCLWWSLWCFWWQQLGELVRVSIAAVTRSNFWLMALFIWWKSAFIIYICWDSFWVVSARLMQHFSRVCRVVWCCCVTVCSCWNEDWDTWQVEAEGESLGWVQISMGFCIFGGTTLGDTVVEESSIESTASHLGVGPINIFREMSVCSLMWSGTSSLGNFGRPLVTGAIWPLNVILWSSLNRCWWDSGLIYFFKESSRVPSRRVTLVESSVWKQHNSQSWFDWHSTWILHDCFRYAC